MAGQQGMGNFTAGFQGGQPPDEEVVVDMVDALERVGSLISVAVQPLPKKGRNNKVLMAEDDVTMYLGLDPSNGETLVPVRSPSIPSFKDKLLGESERDRQFLSLSELDVENGRSRFTILETDEVEGFDGANVNVVASEAISVQVTNGRGERISYVEDFKLHARQNRETSPLPMGSKAVMSQHEGDRTSRDEDRGGHKKASLFRQSEVATFGTILLASTSLDTGKHTMV
ncbi:hypothetical protein V6N12_049214 [Hibiscus sabdariffa]|uniref:Uncharacterized protein n=1 Tax=Hibiscus sabdariffa TaxID=183260 RepID=A0ABR2EJI6_9ROSI